MQKPVLHCCLMVCSCWRLTTPWGQSHCDPPKGVSAACWAAVCLHSYWEKHCWLFPSLKSLTSTFYHPNSLWVKAWVSSLSWMIKPSHCEQLSLSLQLGAGSFLEDAAHRIGLTSAAKGISEVVHCSDNSEAKTPQSLAALCDSSARALHLGTPASRLWLEAAWQLWSLVLCKHRQ